MDSILSSNIVYVTSSGLSLDVQDKSLWQRLNANRNEYDIKRNFVGSVKCWDHCLLPVKPGQPVLFYVSEASDMFYELLKTRPVEPSSIPLWFSN